MKNILVKLAIAIFAFCSFNSFSLTRDGNHTFYFEDRNNKVIEVYYTGSYQYNYAATKWRPLKGAYRFTTSCVSQYSCNANYEAGKAMIDFQSAVLNNALYTIEFELPPGECIPGEPCTQPMNEAPIFKDNITVQSSTSGTVKKSKIDTANAISETVQSLTEAAKTVSEIFDKWSKSDDKANFVIKTSQDGKFQNACFVSGGECKDELDVVQTDIGFEADYTYKAADETQRNFNDMLEDIFLNKPQYQCVLTKICIIDANGNSECTSSFTCFY